MISFEAKRGVYSPQDIIEQQLVPFLIARGFSKEHIHYGLKKHHIAIDDAGKDLMPVDLVVEDPDPASGNPIPRLLVVVKSPGRELRGFVKQAVAMGILYRAPFAMVADGIAGIVLETPSFPKQKDTLPLHELDEFPPLERFRSRQLPAEHDRQLKTLAQQTLRIIKNSGALITILEECDDLLKPKIIDTRRRFFLLSKFLFAKLMDEKAVLKGEAPQLTVNNFDAAVKTGTPLVEQMLRDFAYEYGQDLFQTLRIEVDETLQRRIIAKLEGTEFMASDNDIKGLAYEHFLQSTMRQKDGQYFTPRKVIDFIIEMLRPKTTDKVLDPAAGSGGFLIAYFNYQRNEVLRRYYSDEIDEQERDRLIRSLSNELIHGLELDDDLARLCKMNMIVHGDGHSRVFQGDGLLDKTHENRTVIGEEMFDIIITNPPFGKPVITKKDERLQKFDLGKTIKWDGDTFNFIIKEGKAQLRNQQEPQHLFVERIIRCLKRGGKAAIVLPDGILNNSTDEYARRYIMRDCIVVAVISMPDLTFSNANIRTNVLFIEKKKSRPSNQENDIFMGICDHIGYNSKGEPIEENDLPSICLEFLKWMEQND